MKLSGRLKQEKEFVEQALGALVICERCRATLATYADRCTADLGAPCPGFLAIEHVREKFKREVEVE